MYRCAKIGLWLSSRRLLNAHILYRRLSVKYSILPTSLPLKKKTENKKTKNEKFYHAMFYLEKTLFCTTPHILCHINDIALVNEWTFKYFQYFQYIPMSDDFQTQKMLMLFFDVEPNLIHFWVSPSVIPYLVSIEEYWNKWCVCWVTLHVSKKWSVFRG